MSLESVKPEDSALLKNVSRRALMESVVLTETELQSLIAHTASNIDEYSQKTNRIFLKFLSETTLSGYILIKQYWNLSDLFVLPEFQNTGIGSNLLRQAITQVRLSGESDKIYVNSSLNAELFYRKRGFQDRVKGADCPDYITPLKLELQQSTIST